MEKESKLGTVIAATFLALIAAAFLYNLVTEPVRTISGGATRNYVDVHDK